MKAFLVAVCNAQHGKSNAALLGAAALTVEHLRMVEGQISHIWELFEAGERATLAPPMAGHAAGADPDKANDKPLRTD